MRQCITPSVYLFPRADLFSSRAYAPRSMLRHSDLHCHSGPAPHRLVVQYDMLYERYMRDRHKVAEGHLHELSFDELESDPIAALRAIYTRFGSVLTCGKATREGGGEGEGRGGAGKLCVAGAGGGGREDAERARKRSGRWEVKLPGGVEGLRRGGKVLLLPALAYDDG